MRLLLAAGAVHAAPPDEPHRRARLRRPFAGTHRKRLGHHHPLAVNHRRHPQGAFNLLQAKGGGVRVGERGSRDHQRRQHPEEQPPHQTMTPNSRSTVWIGDDGRLHMQGGGYRQIWTYHSSADDTVRRLETRPEDCERGCWWEIEWGADSLGNKYIYETGGFGCVHRPV